MARFEIFIALLLISAAVAVSACTGQPSPAPAVVDDNMAMQVAAIDLSSPAFRDGDRIPVRYTADGDDMSPPLSWSGVQDVSEYVLICEDPDAPGGTFTHWIMYNIPSGFTSLPSGVPQEEELENGAVQTQNSMGKIGYNGPAPPPGKPHRYIFRLYALDAKMDLPDRITKQQLLDTMKDHVIAEGTLTGMYGR